MAHRLGTREMTSQAHKNCCARNARGHFVDDFIVTVPSVGAVSSHLSVASHASGAEIHVLSARPLASHHVRGQPAHSHGLVVSRGGKQYSSSRRQACCSSGQQSGLRKTTHWQGSPHWVEGIFSTMGTIRTPPAR